MKHTLYILFALLTAAISINAQQTDTLNEHDTWFQYQKDDGFEAFLLDRVDSIVYSRFDLDSVLHDDVVVQEVWFQGQVQRFLIDTIDSISFYKPETKYKDEVFHLTAFHVPYTISIDSLTLTFDPSIASDQLPLVGQVVVSDVRTHPYELGFAGRVRQIDRTAEGIVLVCDRVSIVDIYKQLVAVGHVEATPDDEGPNQPGSTRHRVSVQDENYQLIKDKVIEFPLKVMTITDTISYSIDYTVNIGLLKKPVVKVYVNGRHGMKGESKLTTKDKEKEWDVWPDLLSWNFPIPGLEILTVSLRLGGFAYAGGNMELIGEVPLTMTHRLGFEWEDNQLTPIKKFDYKWGDPEVTLDVKGTLRAGVMMQLGINLISDQIVSANITGKMGPQLDADLVLSSDGVRDLSWYQALKYTKATLSLYTGLDAAFEVFGNDIEDVLDISLTEPWEKNWFKTERYLLPEFTTPQLVPYSPDYDGYSLTSIMTKPSRSTLLPVGVGIGMFDRGGNRIAEKWAGQWWTDDPKKPAKKVQYDLSTADPHQSHVFRPIVRLLGTTIDAYPEGEFTVPGKITLAESSVMMNEGTAKIIEITDGWGIYHNILNQDVVKVTIYGESDGKHYLRLDALQAGETTIDVDDVRTGKTASVRVKVVDPNALIVNPYNVTVAEKQTADVTVKGGFGQYRVSTYDTDKIQVGVDGNIVHITALTPGEAIILVQDSQSDYFANIQVKVDPTPKSVYLAQSSINMTAGDARTIEISGKNGQIEIYKEADFLNIISDTPDVATVRLTPGNTYYMLKVYALKEGVAHVTIEDTTTGDQSTMEVNVGPTSSSTYTVTDGDYTTYVVNGVPFKMINVEGGTYMMGRTPEQAVDYIDKNIHFLDLYIDRVRPSIDGYKLDVPAHEETVTDFSIGEKQVTWELYKAVMGEGNGKDDEPLAIAKSDIDKFITRLCEITKLPFRQPTEAEWEYAARGGKYSKGYKYPGTNDVTAASFGVPNELGISGLVGGYPEVCKDYWERGGKVMVREWGAQEPNHNIIPWISYRGRYYDYHDTGLRLALGGYVCFPDEWLEDEDWLTYFWSNNLKLPLWGERSIPIRGGYGEYEVTCKDPEIATAYTNGDKLVVESHSGGNTTITVTDKKNRSSVDVDVSIDHADFSIHSAGDGISIYEKIPIGIENAIYIRESNGRFKFYVSDESGVKLSMTPDKDLSIKGLKFGKYHVAITDIGSRKTLEWDTEVIDTLGFDRDYIIMREGQTDSVIVTHSNGNIEYYDIFGRYCYDLEDNIIRIPPTVPGTYTITVWDRTLRDSCRFLDVNDTKTITVVVTPDLQKLEQQLKADLQKTADELSSIEQELSKKATEEQAPKLYEEYRQLKDFCASIASMIDSITSEDDIDKSRADLDAIATRMAALRSQVDNYHPVGNIEFADAEVKRLCVANWDTNGDGELSYAEASAVKSIGQVFKKKNITRFDEFKYFEGLQDITDEAFYSCTWLRSITIPNRVNYIGVRAFLGCSSLTTIIIPNSVMVIDKEAFVQCYDLNSVTLSDSLTQIGVNLFFRCTSLTSVTIPNSVTSIGEGAFYGCKKLESINIPKSMTSFTYSAFSGCTGLVSINVDEGNDYFTSEDGVLYNKQKTELRFYPAGKTSESFSIPNSVKTIEDGAFYQCSSLTSVTIPNSVTSISLNAFAGCTGLVSINVDEGNDYFTSKDGVLYNKQKTELLFYLSGKTSDSFSIPQGVKYIESGAFRGCNYLKEIYIPNSVNRLGNMPFLGCASLTDVFCYAKNVPAVGADSFQTLKEVTLHVPASALDKYLAVGRPWNRFKAIVGMEDETPNPDDSIAFADADVKAICVANWDTNGDGELSFEEAAAVTSLDRAFVGNEKITSFDELEYFTGLKWIGVPYENQTNSFAHCSKLESVTIPNTVTGIGNAAFYCSGLTSITIPNSVSSIGKEAFSGCKNLTSVTIPSSVMTIEEGAFANCNSLTNIDVEKGNPAYASAGGVLFDKNRTTIICYPLGKPGNSYIIPNSVRSIGNGTFANSKLLTTITIPNSVTIIGQDAFVGCVGLTSISIPNSVTSIDDRAFYSCVNLTSFTIPNSVTSIGNWAFFDCRKLVTITIPNSVTSIGDGAFQGCSSLNEVKSFITEPFVINQNVFTNSSGNFTRSTLYVPYGTKALYESTDGWKNFANIVEMGDNPTDNIVFADAEVKRICVIYWDANGDGELSYNEAAAVKDLGRVFEYNWEIKSFDDLQYFTGLTTISERALASCLELTSVTLPNSVTSIDTYALFDNYYLNSITIPNSVTYIGRYAFCFCRGLANIVIPNSVTTIDEWAFDGCTKLSSVTIPNSVTSIGESAFFGCSNLNEVYSYIEKPYRVGCWASVDNCTLYVPAGTKAKYEATDGWKGFKNIVEMADE